MISGYVQVLTLGHVSFRRWRDGSTAERRTVEGESLVQSIQLGFGSHCLRVAYSLEGGYHIYPYVGVRPNQLND